MRSPVPVLNAPHDAARPADAATSPVAGAAAVLPPQRWSSRELLGQEREVEIEHEGMVYRLRLTSLGKLILTK